RRIDDRAMAVFGLVCVAPPLLPLGSILFPVIVRGSSVIHVDFFTQIQPTPCSPTPGVVCPQGGIANAIIGTFLLLGLSSAIGIPLGLLAGIYLAEYRSEERRVGTGCRSKWW